MAEQDTGRERRQGPPARSRLLTRGRLTLLAVLLVAAALVYAFWPQPVLVDVGQVARTPLQITVDEEGRTRVRQEYVISAPVAGRLLRVEVNPGDAVEGQATEVARLLPGEPAFLDLRAESQARADLQSAQAALSLAQAELRRVEAEAGFAATELERARTLMDRGVISLAHLERIALAKASADAHRQTARAAVRVREAEVENVRARLLGPAGTGESAGRDDAPRTVAIRAPVGGVVLQVLQQSEAMVVAGTPILVVGDPLSDLEVVAELLSTDAVQVRPGHRAIIENWGGEVPLSGVVERVEPFGFTKVSALGVEEQRVNVVIRILEPPAARPGLGHGFRVVARIVVWSADDVLTVPASALFREGRGWAVFEIVDGRARRRAIEVGRNDGMRAQLLDEEGTLARGTAVVLYPSDRIADGSRVAPRAGM